MNKKQRYRIVWGQNFPELYDHIHDIDRYCEAHAKVCVLTMPPTELPINGSVTHVIFKYR